MQDVYLLKQTKMSTQTVLYFMRNRRIAGWEPFWVRVGIVDACSKTRPPHQVPGGPRSRGLQILARACGSQGELPVNGHVSHEGVRDNYARGLPPLSRIRAATRASISSHVL
jgi:hypothetical protein